MRLRSKLQWVLLSMLLKRLNECLLVEKGIPVNTGIFLLIYNIYMFWVDKLAQELKTRKLKLEWVDDMKTPSGRIHVGSLRGVVINDLIYHGLIDAGVMAKFTYVFEDQDPLDKLPHYLDDKTWGEHLGKPLFQIPSPEKGFSVTLSFLLKNLRRYFII